MEGTAIMQCPVCINQVCTYMADKAIEHNVLLYYVTFAYKFVANSFCLFACLFVCLLACFLVCLFVCLFACFLVCLFVCMGRSITSQSTLFSVMS